MFGWDWGAQLPDIGIWRDLYLECYNAGRIEDVVIRQKHTWKERPQMGELSQEEYIEAVEQSDTVSLSVEVKPEQDTNLENTKVIVTLTDPKGVQLDRFADNKRSSLCRNFGSAAKALVVQWAWGSATV